MDGDDRWAFEQEYQNWDEPSSVPAGEPETEGPTLAGTDPDGVVEVLVTAAAEIVEVRLSREWRRSLDPRVLDQAVLTAANAAVMRALAKSVEDTEIDVAHDQPPEARGESRPLTTTDVQRLLDSVSVELKGFTQELSAVVDRPAQVESSGGHVSGSAERGHFTTLTIDPSWAARVPHTEIAGELTEVLRELHSASTPGELAAGPRGTAITELIDLARDPRLLMRRLGMPAG
ncbi:YbaB/EbfC family nucleoid-associated protein [Amycolatopsis sp. NPDC051371]|uniref:YbaB/EbfC family nucleoid-associated protein n=1 Tax=Amycolatopsis sp. NPDC051371 TaxID=3155800 RepID=UPI00342C7BB9